MLIEIYRMIFETLAFVARVTEEDFMSNWYHNNLNTFNQSLKLFLWLCKFSKNTSKYKTAFQCKRLNKVGLVQVFTNVLTTQTFSFRNQLNQFINTILSQKSSYFYHSTKLCMNLEVWRAIMLYFRPTNMK